MSNIIEILKKGAADPLTLAPKIGDKAFRASIDKGAASPYMEVCQAAGREFYGGKTDDITLIVAQVTTTAIAKPVKPQGTTSDATPGKLAKSAKPDKK